MQYEYHLMGANGMKGIQRETDKRAGDGWELTHAYQETSGGFLFFAGRRHVLISRRQRESPVAPQ